MTDRDMSADAARQEFVFLSAVSELAGKMSSRSIVDKMREIALKEFNSASLAMEPRRLTRLIDDAETDGILEPVSLDVWVATPRAPEFRESLQRALRLPEFA